MTGAGLSCERCVLAEQRSDEHQMEDAEIIPRRQPRPSALSVLARAVSPKLGPGYGRRPITEEKWEGDSLVLVPRFGGGGQIIDCAERELVVLDIAPSRWSSRLLEELRRAPNWEAFAERVWRCAWSEVSEVQRRPDRLVVITKHAKRSLYLEGRQRLFEAIASRPPGWTRREEQATARETISTISCLVVLTLAAGGLLYGVMALLGAVDWGDGTIGASVRWLLVIGGWCTLVVGALLLALWLVGMVMDLRRPPVRIVLRPKQPSGYRD